MTSKDTKIFMPATPPHKQVQPNTWAFLHEPMIAPTGFREYDARWRYPDEINLPGLQALGLGIGTQMHQMGIAPHIILGNDYRDYSLSIKYALMTGLAQAGITCHDIGPALSPTAYFAQFHLDIPAVAMITASHNPNGWTGVKLGFERPLTHGPAEMAGLRDIVLNGNGITRAGGAIVSETGVMDAYLSDLIDNIRLSRPLKIICACGNGTASAFAPKLLEAIGAQVIPLHCDLDYTFPHYNPNPEAMEMLHDMADAVKTSGADLALGFDGDGDRCGVVDDTGAEIFADKMGLILARDLSAHHQNARFVVDVKSTGLYASDPVLKANGAQTIYWKTGHSHMKRHVAKTGALAGFEKSGHYFFADPIGRGYDCGMRVALEICKLLDRNPDHALSDLKAQLQPAYTSPTLSPYCPDTQKYDVLDRIIADLEAHRAADGTLGGGAMEEVLTINGARIQLSGGGFALVRASSNTPNLVVVVESPQSAEHMKAIFTDLDAIIQRQPQIGAYDQTL
jgi:phosphomannomutase/phosphoglucomutase